MMSRRITTAFAASVLWLSSTVGCTTFNSARPLEPGQHAVAVTLGGPIANIPNIGPIPFPHVTVEGRHGLVPDLDVNYGVHLLPLVFGVAGAHVGGTWLMRPQAEYIPAVALGQRIFGFTNILDGRKAAETRSAWLLSQSDLTASWEVYDQLLYAGGTMYLPLLQPEPSIAPFAGVELRPFVDWLRIQVEARYLAPYVNTQFGVADWVAPGDQGAILVNAGAAFVFDLGDVSR